MRIHFVAWLLPFLPLHTFAQTPSTSAGQIAGRWTNKEHTRILEFVPSGSGYDAYIRKAEKKEWLGKKQISGLQYKGSGTYEKGTVYLLQREREVSCSARLSDHRHLQLKASYGGLSKTQTWTRI